MPPLKIKNNLCNIFFYRKGIIITDVKQGQVNDYLIFYHVSPCVELIRGD